MTDVKEGLEDRLGRLERQWNRMEGLLEQILLRQYVDGELLDRLDRAVGYLDDKADQTAHQHWDLADMLFKLVCEPDDPEPASYPRLAWPAA